MLPTGLPVEHRKCIENSHPSQTCQPTDKICCGGLLLVKWTLRCRQTRKELPGTRNDFGNPPELVPPQRRQIAWGWTPPLHPTNTPTTSTLLNFKPAESWGGRRKQAAKTLAGCESCWENHSDLTAHGGSRKREAQQVRISLSVWVC